MLATDLKASAAVTPGMLTRTLGSSYCIICCYLPDGETDAERSCISPVTQLVGDRDAFHTLVVFL